MNTENQQPPPARKASDEDILAAVQQGCQQLGLPVVPTETVSRSLDIKPQTTKRRLDRLAENNEVNKLSVGQGNVWWLPEDADAVGELDTTLIGDTVDYSRLDPANIPEDLAQEIVEEWDDTGIWQALYASGEEVTKITAIPFALGFAVFVADTSISFIQIPQLVKDFAAIAFLGGILFVTLGTILMFIGYFGFRLSDSVVHTTFREKIRFRN